MTILNARQMTTDGLLTLALSVALFAFWESCAYRDPLEPSEPHRRTRFPILFWLMCGVAVLIKGVVGILLPVMIIIVTVIFERLRFRFRWAGRAPGELAVGARWNRLSGIRPVLKRLRLLPGILIVLAVAAPWHLAVWKAGGHDMEGRTFYQEYIVRQHVGRFKGLDKDHNAPLPTYFVYFLFGFFPWACFAPTAFRSPNYEGSHVPEYDGAKRADTDENDRDPFPWPSVSYVSRPEDAVHRFLLIWFWTIFVFFSISAAKLPTYIVPAYPAAAILIGRWFDIALRDASRFPAMWRAIRGVVAIAAIIACAALAVPHLNSNHAFMPAQMIPAVQHIAFALAGGCAIAWLALRNGEVARWRRLGVSALLLTMAVMVGVAVTEGYAATRVYLQEPYQLLARDARADAAAGVPVIFYNIGSNQPSMLFYSADYSPIVRKETPLLPYLKTAIPGAASVDVVLMRKSLEKQLAPEAAAAGRRLDIIETRGSAPFVWCLVRLHLE